MIKPLVFLVLVFMHSVTYGQVKDYSPGFKAGKPTEMEKLSFLEGEWDIDLFYPSSVKDGKIMWTRWASSKSTFTKNYNGVFITENSKGFPINPAHDGISDWEYFAVFSYDRFNETYRIVYSDILLGLSDIYEGDFNKDSLIISNAQTSTYNNHGKNNSPQKNRIELTDIKENEFTVYWLTVDENEIPKGENPNIPWKWSVKMVYKKK